MAIKLKKDEVFRANISNSYDCDINSSEAYGIVSNIEIDRIDKAMQISVAIYGKKSARRQNGKLPLETYNFRLSGDDFDKIVSKKNIVKACYEHISTEERFSQFTSDEI